MSEAVGVLHAHRSVRKFTDQPVPDDAVAQIVEAAYRAPTSVNGQQVSLVVTRDPVRRARIAEIAGGQPWIARAPVFITILIDFHKTRVGLEMAGKPQVIHETMEGLMVGAVDAGIALGCLMVAARALGLGIVPIGGIRSDPQAMIDLLQLPRLTFPIAGVCIGHAAAVPPQKPRLALDSFCHSESYDTAAIPPAIDAYDREIMAYWSQIGRKDGEPWSTNMASYYSSDYFDHVREAAERQGFTVTR